MPEIIVLGTLVLIAAFLYASVGHGGASAYLAILSFYSLSRTSMASSALLLNLLVAGIAFGSFYRASFFSWSLTWPFVLTSFPLAFLGGTLKVSLSLYSLLLAGTLLFASYRLWFHRDGKSQPPRRVFCFLPFALILGGLIGLLSGIVGVGGGIFLSPILLLMGWAGPKQTAAVSAFFIWVNSLAGFLGRISHDQWELSPWFLWMVGFAFLGGWFGAHSGSRLFPAKVLTKILSIVLLTAAMKLVQKVWI